MTPIGKNLPENLRLRKPGGCNYLMYRSGQRRAENAYFPALFSWRILGGVISTGFSQFLPSLSLWNLPQSTFPALLTPLQTLMKLPITVTKDLLVLLSLDLSHVCPFPPLGTASSLGFQSAICPGFSSHLTQSLCWPLSAGGSWHPPVDLSSAWSIFTPYWPHPVLWC